ncbi:phosphoribosylformylglycinamidine synthase subunit PurQ [Caldivirga maquilingensis]|uniref:Phosphoribosylformylglycinamidine synthase subunit PurQ n=1 Tax=Caldivirga maquilingensis (strain ATCC 700844 / DSM 13496 / JCM 10307 / IC-167) TaxID=397948 RepID=A8MCJ5_CALMQ|nr:phosphoribosylformylglycinamidine synthase subunit PurQ [Caldivirga maquilingensis]ABW01501.1 phosphoribosylformylglycinamidine synthase I [Caldivirga maquilingensis IC-167]
MVTVAVIKFPGTNADNDVTHVLNNVINVKAESIWYSEFKHSNYDAVILPGGFSYGDWLRAGAIAARSKTINEVKEAAEEGKPILGICNGFQTLVEAGLLPGVLLPNDPPRFIARWVKVQVIDSRTPFTIHYEPGAVASMPIAHGEGRFHAVDLSSINIVFKYSGFNPNGSLGNVAGVSNNNRNVVGLMPHPERAAEDTLVPRGFDKGGLRLWVSLRESLRRGW